MTLKCYWVHGSSMETQQLIFAETRGKAIQVSDAYSESGDWLDVRAIRKPEFDHYHEASYIPKWELLADGWWFECNGTNKHGNYCSNHLTADDFPLIVDEKVYCNKDCMERNTKEESQ